MDVLVVRTKMMQATPNIYASMRKKVEAWDDDGDFILENDDQLVATASPIQSKVVRFPTHQIEQQQDLEYADEIHLSTEDLNTAVQATIEAGIPISRNTPASALMGGTIHRMGGKLQGVKRVMGNKQQQAVVEDWSDDLEVEDGDDWNVKPTPLSRETLEMFASGQLRSASAGSSGSDLTITNSRSRANTHGKPVTITEEEEEDFGEGFDLPESMSQFTLKKPVLRANTAAAPADIDFEEWLEGSLGTRHGGTHRFTTKGGGGSSESRASFSPTGSERTVESDDDAFDLEGLRDVRNLKQVFESRLRERLQKEDQFRRAETINSSPLRSRSQQRQQQQQHHLKPIIMDDFSDGLVVDDSFEHKTRTLKRNVQRATPSHRTSPQRRVAMSVTFSEKPSRLPRATDVVTGTPTERSKIPIISRKMSLMSLKSEQQQPSQQNNLQTPSNRMLSRDRKLSAKASMPILRQGSTTPAPPLSDYRVRSPRVTELRPSILPKSSTTPSLELRPAFISAGSYTNQSHHITIKRQPSTSNLYAYGSTTPQPSPQPPTSPRKYNRPKPELVQEANRVQHVVRPTIKRRDFGDGTELDTFDDLPVNVAQERTFRKSPTKKQSTYMLNTKSTLAKKGM